MLHEEKSVLDLHLPFSHCLTQTLLVVWDLHWAVIPFNSPIIIKLDKFASQKSKPARFCCWAELFSYVLGDDLN